MKILVIADEGLPSLGLSRALRSSGHQVTLAGDYRAALQLLRDEIFDVVLLGRSAQTPGESAFISQMPEEAPPVLLLPDWPQPWTLAAHGPNGPNGPTGPHGPGQEPAGVLEWLSAAWGHGGAPANGNGPGGTPGVRGLGEAQILAYGDLTLNLRTREALRQGRRIRLTEKEARLLEVLMRNPGGMVSRECFLRQVWGYQFNPQTNLVEVHLSRLRLKIDKGFDRPVLKTVHGQGYMLD